MRGMFIQCGGCGFTRHIDLSGDFDKREAELNAALKEGWRYVDAWKGYICPKCSMGGFDKLYEMVCGRPKARGLLESYIELRWQADEQLEMFRQLEVGAG